LPLVNALRSCVPIAPIAIMRLKFSARTFSNNSSSSLSVRFFNHCAHQMQQAAAPAPAPAAVSAVAMPDRQLIKSSTITN
jgi:hypothetical protein